MASFNGYLPNVIPIDATGTSPGMLLSRPGNVPTGLYWSLVGELMSPLPVTLSAAWTGTSSLSGTASGVAPPTTHGDLFFERMHVFPASENVGTILATVTSHFQYLNAYTNTAQTLTNIVTSGLGVAGTTIEDSTTSAAPVFPILLNGMVSRLFNFSVLGTGDATIEIDFDFSMLDPAVPTPTFKVVGSRAVMFPFIPQRPLTETIDFLTNVIEAYDGTEQRISTRTQGRQIFDMKYFLESDDPAPSGADKFATAQALIVGMGGNPLGVGMWHQARKLTADVAIGATSANLVTSDIDFRVGGYAVLFSDWNDNEILSIQSVTPTSVSFVSPTEKDFVVGDYLVPMQLCVADDGVKFSQHKNNLATVTAKWTSTETTGDLAAYASLYSRTWAPPGASYSAIPIVEDHNILTGSELKESVTLDFTAFDPGTGGIDYSRRKLAPVPETQKRWEIDGRDAMADTMALRKFIYWARGKLKTFWFPSNRQDFRVSDDLTVGSNILKVYGSGYSTRVGPNAPYDHIRVTYVPGTAAHTASPDGTLHKITNAVQPDSAIPEEELTLTNDSGSGWSANTPKEDIQQICFLFKTRFKKDSAQIKHEGQGRTSLTMPLVGVKQ